MKEIFEILQDNEDTKTIVVHKEIGSKYYFEPAESIPEELPDYSKIVYDDEGNTWMGICLDGEDIDETMDLAWAYFLARE